MTQQVPISELLVEGKNDQHVIWALCGRHGIPETFTVRTPKDETGGIDELLDIISVRLKTSGLRALGIVVDADQNVANRWTSVSHRLAISGYQSIPDQLDPQGTILEQGHLPRVGIWLMPNNELPGMLEDFVKYLVPPDDQLLPKAEQILIEIEQENLQQYSSTHRAKALIHTWLV